MLGQIQGRPRRGSRCAPGCNLSREYPTDAAAAPQFGETPPRALIL